jgi:hypothetical protein
MVQKIEKLLAEKGGAKKTKMGADDEVDIPAKLRQKLGEIVNKNLDRKNERRVALLAEFYGLCVTRCFCGSGRIGGSVYGRS